MEKLRILEKKHHPTIAIRTASSRFFLLFDNEKSSKIKNGILLHYVFEQLGEKSQLDLVLKHMLHAGLIGYEQIDLLKSEANKLLDNAKMASWFDGSWKLINERPVITPQGNIRPDRVMLKGDNVVIIDYKTGSPEAGHNKQMESYRKALTNMGYENILAYLIYFAENEMIEVA